MYATSWPGPVVGDLPAAVDLEHRNAVVAQQMLAPARRAPACRSADARSARSRRRVLARARVGERLHRAPRRLVVGAAERAHGRGRHGAHRVHAFRGRQGEDCGCGGQARRPRNAGHSTIFTIGCATSSRYRLSSCSRDVALTVAVTTASCLPSTRASRAPRDRSPARAAHDVGHRLREAVLRAPHDLDREHARKGERGFRRCVVRHGGFGLRRILTTMRAVRAANCNPARRTPARRRLRRGTCSRASADAAGGRRRAACPPAAATATASRGRTRAPSPAM